MKLLFLIMLPLLGFISQQALSDPIDLAIASTPQYLACDLGKNTDNNGEIQNYELAITGIQPQFSPITPVAFLFKKINGRSFKIITADILKIYNADKDLLLQGKNTKLIVKGILNKLANNHSATISYKNEEISIDNEVTCEPNFHSIDDILNAVK